MNSLKRLGGPDAELGGADAVDAVAHGDDRVEVVVLEVAIHLPRALALNCQDSFDSSLALQLTGLEDQLDVVGDGLLGRAEKLGHPVEGQPERLVLEVDLDLGRPFGRRVEDDLAFARSGIVAHVRPLRLS